MSDQNHIYGNLESNKFGEHRESYYHYLDKLKDMNYDFTDFIHHFPVFPGHLAISRFLGLYELYKLAGDSAGHIAEVGVFKGASAFWLAKLVRIFENESLTQVHGFDWFQGNVPTEMEKGKIVEGGYAESYERISELVALQKLDSILKIHKLDVTKELDSFFEKYPHLRFKMVFLDAGLYDVVKACLKPFWDRLEVGGILVFDQYNHELSPGETLVVKEQLPHVKVRTLKNIWMPSGYIIKE